MNGRDKVNSNEPGRHVSSTYASSMYARTRHKQEQRQTREQEHQRMREDQRFQEQQRAAEAIVGGESGGIISFTSAEELADSEAKGTAEVMGDGLQHPHGMSPEEVVKHLASVQVPRRSNLTYDRTVDLLLSVWGFDDPEELIDWYSLNEVVKLHMIFARRAQHGRLNIDTSPAGYFRNTLKARNAR